MTHQYHSIPCIAFVAVFITNLAVGCWILLDLSDEGADFCPVKLAITKKDPPHRAEPLGVYCHLINPLG